MSPVPKTPYDDGIKTLRSIYKATGDVSSAEMLNQQSHDREVYRQALSDQEPYRIAVQKLVAAASEVDAFDNWLSEMKYIDAIVRLSDALAVVRAATEKQE